jgi:hypothetical protein
VAIEATDFTLPELAKVLFALALVAFAIAGIFGILANRPDYYEEVDTAWLRKTMSPVAWNYNNLALAKRRTSEARVKSIDSFREKNQQKVKLLTRAIGSEVAAVGLVAVGVGVLLFS